MNLTFVLHNDPEKPLRVLQCPTPVVQAIDDDAEGAPIKAVMGLNLLMAIIKQSKWVADGAGGAVLVTQSKDMPDLVVMGTDGRRMGEAMVMVTTKSDLVGSKHVRVKQSGDRR